MQSKQPIFQRLRQPDVLISGGLFAVVAVSFALFATGDMVQLHKSLLALCG
jgi:hypothetical protein